MSEGKAAVGWRIRLRPVLHPLLFAAFPVIYLWARNADEGLSAGEVLRPLAVILLLTGALQAAFWWAYGRDLHRAGLALTPLVLLFFSYGYAAAALGWLGRPRYLLPIWAILAVGAIMAATASKRRAAAWTGVLNWVAAGLVLLNLASLGWHGLRYRDVPASLERSDGPAPTLNARGRRRDIYYIVLEEYAGRRVLQEFWGYDNTPFLDFLRSKGFFVADDSTANYPRTAPSVASSLNMEYVSRDEGFAPEPTFDALIRDHAVARLLKDAGYRYVHIGSWLPSTATNPQADQNIVFRTGLSRFSSLLYETTVLYQVTQHLGWFRTALDLNWREHQRVLFQFSQIDDVRSEPGPKFVFAHIVAPHDPYTFDRDGRFVSIDEAYARPAKELYLDQLIYVNELVRNMVERLLSGPAQDRPIVIIQSDEGPYGGDPPAWNALDPDARLLRRKFDILNAYYLPGDSTSELYPSITPVNSFRVIFDDYFDAGMPLLPDRNYIFRDLQHLQDFTDVTKMVRRELGISPLDPSGNGVRGRQLERRHMRAS